MGGMKLISEDQLASRLSSPLNNPRIVFSGNLALPQRAVKIIDKVFDTYTFHTLNAPVGVPTRDGVVAETTFVGPGMRKHPNLRYVPSRLSLTPLLYSRSLPPDIVVIHCAPPLRGQLSLGIEVNVMPAAIEACRARGGIVIAVINKHMPYCFGDAQIPESYVDFAVEVDEPLVTITPKEPDDDSKIIGDRVADRVADGSTMQLGIGAVPDAVLSGLTNRSGIRIWTEMFSDGVLDLHKAGALDPDHPLVSSFLFGSQELYDWVDQNPRVRMMRTERTNDPSYIALQRLMVSVNTALQVDLFGQANASRLNARIYSGFGGQTDFIVGALHSPGGQSFIALKSWHPKANISTIVPLVDEPVTSFQQTAFVTEHGVAPLFGYSEREQAAAIIENVAHPDVRSELWEEAGALGLA